MPHLFNVARKAGFPVFVPRYKIHGLKLGSAPQLRLFHSSSASPQHGKTSIPNIREVTSSLPKKKLPFYKQLLAFDECTVHNCSFDNYTGQLSGGIESFWNAVYKIVPLYSELSYTGELTERRMDGLVSLLRNGLRVQRLELSKLKKNLDRDTENPLKQKRELLTEAIMNISNDILNGTNIKIGPIGMTNLFKAYNDLGLAEEATAFWQKGKDDKKLSHLFASESVLGSVFQFLVDGAQFDFAEVEAIFEKVKQDKLAEKGPSAKLHSELLIGMIKVCLVKGETEKATILFKDMTSSVYHDYSARNLSPPSTVKSYMTQAHLAFIGYCSDLETADIFFESAVEQSLPYNTPLQINYVKPYLLNTWDQTKDFDRVMQIWETTWTVNEESRRSNSSLSSSLNDVFLHIFFEKYPKFNVEAAKVLKSIITRYSNIRTIDEPFFNCLLIHSTKWGNVKVLKSIIKVADLYNFPKTSVFYRCCLKASGAVDFATVETLGLVNELLNANVRAGAKSIVNADWLAIRDATIRSPRLTNERVDLYFKLWKLCSPYFLNSRNLRSYKHADIKLNRAYSRVFQQIDSVDANDVKLPQLSFLITFQSIEERSE